MWTSLTGNVLLAIVLITHYLNQNTVHEVLFVEVQYSLVELDGVIQYQQTNEWSEPNLVTSKLNEVLNRLETAKNSGSYSGWLSKTEKKIMEQFYMTLSLFPHNQSYEFSVLNQSDIQRFEALRSSLRSVGIGMDLQSTDWEGFISAVERLEILIHT